MIEKLKILLILSIFSLFIISCKTERQLNKKFSSSNKYSLTHLSPDWKLTPLEAFKRSLDTLTIFAEFADCGEWGGHHEKFIIYSNWTDTLVARFTIDSVRCSEIYDKNNRKVLIDTSFYINSKNETQISKYIQELAKMKLYEVTTSNSGNLYVVHNSNSFLYITFYDTREKWEGFMELKKKLLRTKD